MSYAFLGHKWGVPDFGEAGGTVTWSADLSGLDFDTALYDMNDFEVQLGAAFQAWEDVAAIDFEEVASGGNVRVRTGDLDPGEVGLTSWFVANLPGLENPAGNRMDVTFDQKTFWSPDGSGFGTDFYAVAAHEIGHVMGLDHVPDSTQLMYALTSGPDDIAMGDMIGAQILYGADAGDPDLSPLPEPPPESDFDPEEDDGGAGGAMGAILLALLGLVAALFGGLLGGGAGGAAAVAAAQTRAPEDDETLTAWGEEALDWLPTLPPAAAAEAAMVENDFEADLLDWI